MIFGVVASGKRRGGAVGHRYWRINVSAVVVTSYTPIISELQLRTVVGGPSVATGGTASASSFVSVDPASYAFDGSTSTYWLASGGVPQWLEYDFGATTAPRIVEYAIDVSHGTATNSPLAWTLERSDDGSTWTVADTQTGQTGWVSNTYNVYTVANP